MRLKFLVFYAGAACVGVFLALGLSGALDQPPAAPPAPQQPKIAANTDLKIVYSGEGPTDWKNKAHQALNDLLAACPTLRGAVRSTGEVTTSWFEPVYGSLLHNYGWHHMLVVELDLPDSVAHVLPAELQDPANGLHLMYQLGAGTMTGALSDQPIGQWLCDLPTSGDSTLKPVEGLDVLR